MSHPCCSARHLLLLVEDHFQRESQPTRLQNPVEDGMNHPLEIPPVSPVPVGEPTWLAWSSHHWLLDDCGLCLSGVSPVSSFIIYITLKRETGARQSWCIRILRHVVVWQAAIPILYNIPEQKATRKEIFLFLGKKYNDMWWFPLGNLGHLLRGTVWQRWSLTL